MYWFSFTSLSTTLIQASVTYNSPLIGLTPSTIVLLFYSQYSQSDLLKIQISAHSHLCIKIKCKVISIASRPCMIYLCLPLRHLMSLLPLLTTMLTPAFFFFTKCTKSLPISSASHMLFPQIKKLFLHFAWWTAGHLRSKFNLYFGGEAPWKRKSGPLL